MKLLLRNGKLFNCNRLITVLKNILKNFSFPLLRFVKVGDTVQQFDNLCEVQSDKASVTITSRYDGKIVKLHHNIDDVALVGKALLDFDVEEEDGDSDSSDSESEDERTPAKKVEGDVAAKSTEATDEEVNRHITLATPAVRRIAKENKVDLSKVTPTGKNGRVLKGDVLEYLGQVPPGTNIPHPTIAAKAASPSVKASVPVPADRVEPLKGVRKAMLKSMSESLVSFECNIQMETELITTSSCNFCFFRKSLTLPTATKLT